MPIDTQSRFDLSTPVRPKRKATPKITKPPFRWDPDKVPPTRGTDRLIKIGEVLELTGIGNKSTVYRHMEMGSFPRQRHIGCSARWSLSEISYYIECIKGA